jgi:hypothetical protein
MKRLYDEKAAAMGDTPGDTRAHHNQRSEAPQEGRATFSQVFTVAVIFLLGIQGLKFITPWYDYLRLQGAMQESVNQAPLLTDGDMISAVMTKAKELKLPLTPRDIHVDRRGQGGIRLWADYNVTLTFPLGFSYTQSFRPEVRSVRL